MPFQEDAKTMMRSITALVSAGMLSAALPALPALAAEAPLRADQQTFHDTYKELVETNTTLSAGSCTLAATRMAARLRAGGMPTTRSTFTPIPRIPRTAGWSRSIPGLRAH
jgi:hypothetical protein